MISFRIFLLLLIIPYISFTQDKVRFFAGGITCSLCSNAIHKSLKTNKNIINIDTNLETQEWFLEYKSGTFDKLDLIKRVEDAGFTITKLWYNNQIILESKTKNKKHGHKEK